MKCAHCRAPGADNTWDLAACADAGRKRVFRLCHKCDVALNLLVMEFFGVANAKAKIAAYAAREREDEKS